MIFKRAQSVKLCDLHQIANSIETLLFNCVSKLNLKENFYFPLYEGLSDDNLYS